VRRLGKLAHRLPQIWKSSIRKRTAPHTLLA
jgi:hypothetical protein